MSILAWQGLAVKLHLAKALRQTVARSSDVTKRSVHQDKHHHLLNMPSPPLPTPRLHPLPDPLAHALRVQLQHPPRPTARATPPPAPRRAASPPAGLYSASDRTPLGALFFMSTITSYHTEKRPFQLSLSQDSFEQSSAAPPSGRLVSPHVSDHHPSFGIPCASASSLCQAGRYCYPV